MIYKEIEASKQYLLERKKRFSKLALKVKHDNKQFEDVFLDHALPSEAKINLQNITSKYISACFAACYGNEYNNLNQIDLLEKLDDPKYTLVNKTPNGVLLCKHETTLEFNLLHKAVAKLFLSFGFKDLTEFWQAPLNVRVVLGKDEHVVERPYESSKLHSDVWIGEPADMILVNIPILGDIENTTLEWYLPPNNIGESHLRHLTDFSEGLEIAKKFNKLNLKPKLGHIYFSDPTTLHQTKRKSGKVRVSIDFRFRMKVSDDYRKLVVESCKPEFLKNYIYTDDWFAIGSESIIYVGETMSEASKKYASEGTKTRNIAANRVIQLSNTTTEDFNLSKADFAKMFGLTTESDLPKSCLQEISNQNFKYKTLSFKESSQLVSDILAILESEHLSIVGSHRKPIWEKGWSENLEDFKLANFNIKQLNPKYFKRSPFVRLNNEFVKPYDNDFEINFFTILRHWIYQKFLYDADSIYEFGCGTGLNLALLARIYPTKQLHGLDWTVASQEILERLATKFGWKITGHSFDLFNPDYSFDLGKNSAIMTSTALEQLGDKFEPFIEYLLEKSPQICLHVEPIVELYDDNMLLDKLAIRYHNKRGYLHGFLPKLREFEQQKRLDIVFLKRVNFGNHLHDGYSIIVWRPADRK
jgi:hypothetical protein